MKRIAQPALRARGVAGLTGVLLAQVPAYHVGVLKIDGKIERLLDAGVAAFWRFNRDVAVEPSTCVCRRSKSADRKS